MLTDWLTTPRGFWWAWTHTVESQPAIASKCITELITKFHGAGSVWRMSSAGVLPVLTQTTEALPRSWRTVRSGGKLPCLPRGATVRFTEGFPWVSTLVENAGKNAAIVVKHTFIICNPRVITFGLICIWGCSYFGVSLKAVWGIS